jgi:hypothetical protein
MENKSSLKRIVWSLAYVTLVFAGLRMATGSESVRTQQNERFVPITITGRLQPEDGLIPVEIQCGTAHLSSPNTLERIDCSLKNNSAKSVTAANVTYSVFVQTSAGSSKQTLNRTLDALIHPDFKLSNQLVVSGEKTDVGTPGPTSYPDGIVESVSIAIDYVEFEDGTRLGPDREGSRLIAETRQGAIKYKEWLQRQYKQGGNTVEAVIPLLESSRPLPQELTLTEREEAGANAYKRGALRLEKRLGRPELDKRLH